MTNVCKVIVAVWFILLRVQIPLKVIVIFNCRSQSAGSSHRWHNTIIQTKMTEKLSLSNVIDKFYPVLKERLDLQQSLRIFEDLIEDH